MGYHKPILITLPHRPGLLVCQCHLSSSAAAAAHYNQCVRLRNCHLCTFWYCFFVATYTIALHASHYYSECSTAL
jgi:hypothetical protein